MINPSPSPSLVLAGDRTSASRLLAEAAGRLGPAGVLGRTPGEAGDVAAAHPGLSTPLSVPGQIRSARVVILCGASGDGSVSFASRLRLHETGAVVILAGASASSWSREIRRACGLPPRRLLATAGLPEQLRLEREIAWRAGVSRSQVSAPVIGRSDGAVMPLRRHLRVAGAPPGSLGGGEGWIPGGGHLPPAADLWSRAAILLAGSVLWGRRAVLSCAAFHPAEAGMPEGFYTVPSIIGKEGLEGRLELALTLEERSFLSRA